MDHRANDRSASNISSNCLKTDTSEISHAAESCGQDASMVDNLLMHMGNGLTPRAWLAAMAPKT